MHRDAREALANCLALNRAVLYGEVLRVLRQNGSARNVLSYIQGQNALLQAERQRLVALPEERREITYI